MVKLEHSLVQFLEFYLEKKLEYVILVKKDFVYVDSYLLYIQLVT